MLKDRKLSCKIPYLSYSICGIISSGLKLVSKIIRGGKNGGRQE
jgi:hypothetical protein